jgi:alpha-ketoglutarate-dependent taurine dioxygenase
MPSFTNGSSKSGPGLQRTPLQYSGSFDEYESIDLAAAIGREYPKVQLRDIIVDDSKIRDLAILCSQRGVVFFRNQDINAEELKVLTSKLGELTGKPEDSKVRSGAMQWRAAANGDEASSTRIE